VRQLGALQSIIEDDFSEWAAGSITTALCRSKVALPRLPRTSRGLLGSGARCWHVCFGEGELLASPRTDARSRFICFPVLSRTRLLSRSAGAASITGVARTRYPGGVFFISRVHLRSASAFFARSHLEVWRNPGGRLPCLRYRLFRDLHLGVVFLSRRRQRTSSFLFQTRPGESGLVTQHARSGTETSPTYPRALVPYQPTLVISCTELVRRVRG
jgi:hypothetical protein